LRNFKYTIDREVNEANNIVKAVRDHFHSWTATDELAAEGSSDFWKQELPVRVSRFASLLMLPTTM